MSEQIHRRLSDVQVKAILSKYYTKDFQASKAIQLLGIKKTQFFEWAKRFKQDPTKFSISYKRIVPTRKISVKVENAILEELKIEKKLIDDKKVPVHFYNYSYIQNHIENRSLKVSIPTIIKRAKEHGFYIPKKEIKKHDREVITNYPGELIQHDSSHHQFSPHADKEWYLITSIDDCSRFILFGKLVERETSWRHIEALEYVFSTTGVPIKYYVDSHAIFRYIPERDSLYNKYVLKEDQIKIQWKSVLNDLKVEVTHALSPQAKGKVERPYRWLQDHLVRTCFRENISKISDGNAILRKEINHYNYHQIHSTTGKIPAIQLEKAVKEKRTLFTPFKIPYPYISTKDIFCLRDQRTTDAYRKISLYGMELRIPANPYEKIDIRMVPNEKTGITEIRLWSKNKLIDIQKLKNTDLKNMPF